jgi:hypothetical protein
MKISEDVPRRFDLATEEGTRYLAARKLWKDGCGGLFKAEQALQNDIYSPEQCRSQVLLFSIAKATLSHNEYQLLTMKSSQNKNWNKLKKSLKFYWDRYVDDQQDRGTGFYFVGHHIPNRNPCQQTVCPQNDVSTVNPKKKQDSSQRLNFSSTDISAETTERLIQTVKGSGVDIKDEPIVKRRFKDENSYENSELRRLQIISMINEIHWMEADRNLFQKIFKLNDFRENGIMIQATAKMVLDHNGKDKQLAAALGATGFRRQAILPELFKQLRILSASNNRSFPHLTTDCIGSSVNNNDSSCLSAIPMNQLENGQQDTYPNAMLPYVENCGICHAGQIGPMGFLTGKTDQEKKANFVARSHRIAFRLNIKTPVGQRMPAKRGAGKKLYRKLWGSDHRGSELQKKMYQYAVCLSKTRKTLDDISAMDKCSF